MNKYSYQFKVFTSALKPTVKMNYMIGLPNDRKPGEKLPMIVCLHGAGEGGKNPELIKVHGIPKMLDDGLPVRAIILAPQIQDHHVWNTLADETAELIRNIAGEYDGDEKRISLTGLSMGGYGTWEIGTSNPGLFSALAPICGGGMPWRARYLKDIPIRAYHGDCDTVVPLSNTIEMVDSVNANGGNAECIILHGVGHGSWEWAYSHSDLIKWLVQQQRS